MLHFVFRYWLEEYRKAKQENREPKLWKAMLRAYWLSYIPGVVYILGSTVVKLVLAFHFYPYHYFFI